MVRLRLFLLLLFRYDQAQFQFRYGSIKTKNAITTPATGLRFNSDMVRLRLSAAALPVAVLVCFNSDMVRLRLQYW